jgi:hypothetical protein
MAFDAKGLYVVFRTVQAKYGGQKTWEEERWPLAKGVVRRF